MLPYPLVGRPGLPEDVQILPGDSDMYEFPPTAMELNPQMGYWLIGVFLVVLTAAIVAFLRFRTGDKACVFWMVACWGSLIVFIRAIFFVHSNRTWIPSVVLAISTAICAVSFAGYCQTLRSKEQFSRRLSLALLLFVPSTLVLILVLMALPAVGDAGPASARTSCKNNLKQLALAMHNYHDVFEMFPPSGAGQPAVSWRIHLLPYLESASVAAQYDKNSRWDSTTNSPLQRTEIDVYSCPSRLDNVDSKGRFRTSYVVPSGPGTIFGTGRGTSIKEIPDGTSNTLMVLEACGTNIIWTEPRDMDGTDHDISVNGPGPQIGISNSMMSSWHTGGAQAALADGSVRFISQNIEWTGNNWRFLAVTSQPAAMQSAALFARRASLAPDFCSDQRTSAVKIALPRTSISETSATCVRHVLESRPSGSGTMSAS
jgi:hypothetical protein